MTENLGSYLILSWDFLARTIILAAIFLHASHNHFHLFNLKWILFVRFLLLVVNLFLVLVVIMTSAVGIGSLRAIALVFLYFFCSGSSSFKIVLLHFPIFTLHKFILSILTHYLTHQPIKISFYVVVVSYIVKTFHVSCHVFEEMRILHFLIQNYLPFFFQLKIILHADFATMKLMKVYLVTISEYVYCSHKINLILVHPYIVTKNTPRFSCVSNPTLDPHTLFPTELRVWLKLL